MATEFVLDVILLVCNARGAEEYKGNKNCDRSTSLRDISFGPWVYEEMSIWRFGRSKIFIYDKLQCN